MKNLFGEKRSAGQSARDAMRKRQWSKAVESLETLAKDRERDYALWNLIGDVAMNSKSRSKAVESWRRALDGYASEGLHENALGVARKMLRRTPEEEDVYLLTAESYLSMDYHADCLSAVRSYIKLAKNKSESDLRSTFRKILETDISHPHLLDELTALFTESGIEDIELQRKLEKYVEQQRANAVETPAKVVAAPQADVWQDEAPAMRGIERAPASFESNGLMDLDAADQPHFDAAGYQFTPVSSASASTSLNGDAYVGSASTDEGPPPTSEGKDHYDLGMVYREMKLWDAAGSEFDKARNDPALRLRSTLALAECLQESGDLQGALSLLEKEKEANGGSPTERMGLHFQLGVIHELLGNLDEALSQFEWVQSQNGSHAEADLKVQSLSRKLGRTISK